MNKNIVLLSIDDLKESSIIDNNVEDKILESSVIDAQNIDIQNIIGTTLYEYVLELVEDGDIDGTFDEAIDTKSLLDDYIQPALLKFALYRTVMPMRVHFRNKGLMENSSDNSQPVDKEFVTYVENKLLNDAEFYANKLKGYLCWFFNKYPDLECDKPDNRADYNEPNKNNAYFAGIQL